MHAQLHKLVQLCVDFVSNIKDFGPILTQHALKNLLSLVLFLFLTFFLFLPIPHCDLDLLVILSRLRIIWISFLSSRVCSIPIHCLTKQDFFLVYIVIHIRELVPRDVTKSLSFSRVIHFHHYFLSGKALCHRSNITHWSFSVILGHVLLTVQVTFLQRL